MNLAVERVNVVSALSITEIWENFRDACFRLKRKRPMTVPSKNLLKYIKNKSSITRAFISKYYQLNVFSYQKMPGKLFFHPCSFFKVISFYLKAKIQPMLFRQHSCAEQIPSICCHCYSACYRLKQNRNHPER